MPAKQQVPDHFRIRPAQQAGRSEGGYLPARSSDLARPGVPPPLDTFGSRKLRSYQTEACQIPTQNAQGSSSGGSMLGPGGTAPKSHPAPLPIFFSVI